MKFPSAVTLAALIGTTATSTNAWIFSPCKKKKTTKLVKTCLGKKAFLAGVGAATVATAAGVAVVGTVGTATAAAAINNQLNNNNNFNINGKVVYEPEAGSLTGQVILITGASSGLGLESAKRLAAGGATVVLTSRTSTKGDEAVTSVKKYLEEKKIEDTPEIYNLVLDLDDLENVKQFAESYKALDIGDISVLLNNAGCMAIPDRQLTKDGYERQFQSNHLGHFVLTATLFPFLSRDGAKVINVSSEAINFAQGGLDTENLNGEQSYSPWPAYGQSKLSNVLFTKELQRKADNAGQDWLTSVTLHPGVVSTDLWRNIVGEERFNDIKGSIPSGVESIVSNIASLNPFTKTVAEGASTQVFLASTVNSTDLVKGAFYDDMKVKENLPKFALDEEKAEALWEISEDLGGIQFDLTALDIYESESDSNDEDKDEDDEDVVVSVEKESSESVLDEISSPDEQVVQDSDETDYSSKTVEELKDVLRERGLGLSGKKADLVSRLEENDRSTDDDDDNIISVDEDEEKEEGNVSEENAEDL